jgi:hypothetical protein
LRGRWEIWVVDIRWFGGVVIKTWICDWLGDVVGASTTWCDEWLRLINVEVEIIIEVIFVEVNRAVEGP